jgi:NADH:ubiquinone oxidoreductase subunit F (NADH-binding)
MTTLTIPAPPARSGLDPAGPPTPPARRPGLPRLLSGPGDVAYAAHLAHWGPLPAPADLTAEVDRAGLRGRGGAGFPTARKMDAVRRAAAGRRRPVVVANGAEGEPVSAKDRVLLARDPHLVIDGMLAAAAATRADRAILCVKQGQPELIATLTRAVAERPGGDVRLEVAPVPSHYLVGEESALMNWLDRRRALPTVTPPRPAERGLGRRPTLVDNVETLANIALIARFGAPWIRQVGTADEPGSMLVTVTGGVERPGVMEVPFGTPLVEVLRRAAAGPAAAVLVGGYFGTWLSPAAAAGAELSRAGLAAVGAGLGCGAVSVLPDDVCPLVEVARVARWLAGQSAGQCGPCANGLPAIAGALDQLAAGHHRAGVEADVARWSEMTRGRGACKLPDGAVHFVQSALDVFEDHVAAHRRNGPCPSVRSRTVLPTPAWDPVR